MALRVIQGIEELTSLVGRPLGTSDWLEITQECVNAFAAATGDHQWIHCDPARAAVEGPYGTTVAHGFLTLSLCIALTETSFRVEGVTMIINYGLNRVRFPAPVRVGSRVRMHSELLELREAAEGYQGVFKHTIEAEGESRPACVMEAVLRLFF